MNGKQPIVSGACHAEVIKLAHSSSLVGHLGVRPAVWPGIRSDAVESVMYAE